jgi:COMPASS component BRE2
VKSHVRIGIATKNFNPDIPIGSQKNSYSYRDSDGKSCNDGYAYDYGESYGVGDIIGLLIHMGPPKPPVK